MKRKCFLCLLLTWFSFSKANAQKSSSTSTEEISLAEGILAYDISKSRTKFFELETQTLPSYRNLLNNGQLTSINDLDKVNRYVNGKLRFPVVLKQQFKLGGELAYQKESFTPGYHSLGSEPISLNKVGLTLFADKRLEDRKFLTFFVKGAIKSDELNFDRFNQKLALTAAAIWGIKKNPNEKMAFGMAVSNNLGRLRIGPVFIYEKCFNDRLRLDLMLPKKAELIYGASAKTFFSALLDLETASYLLVNPVLEGHENLEFRRSAIRLSLKVEQQINDWIGISGQVGMAQPINTLLVERGRASGDHVWNFNQRLSPYAGVSLYAIIPSRLLK